MSNYASHTLTDELFCKEIFPPIKLTKSQLRASNIALISHYIDDDDYLLTITFRLYLPLFGDEISNLIELYMAENNLEELDIENDIPQDKMDEIYENAYQHLLEYAQEKLAVDIGIPIPAQRANEIENTSQSTYCDIDASFYIMPGFGHTDDLDHLMFYRINVKSAYHAISVDKSYAHKKGIECLGLNAEEQSDEDVLTAFGRELVYYFPWNMHWAAEYGYEVTLVVNDDEVEFTYHFYGDNYTGSAFNTENSEDLIAYVRELRPIKCD